MEEVDIGSTTEFHALRDAVSAGFGCANIPAAIRVF
jgi:hypothetical protein